MRATQLAGTWLATFLMLRKVTDVCFPADGEKMYEQSSSAFITTDASKTIIHYCDNQHGNSGYFRK